MKKKNISRCLDSILNQTFSDFEVICIDDGSTDKTFEIIKGYSEKDSRIIPIKNNGKGVSEARNFGIENSHGDYLGFVDSDDFIQPQMFEFLYRAIKENECDMSVCGFERVREYKSKKFEYNCRECTCDEFISFNSSDYVLKNEMKVSGIWCKLINKKILKNDIRFEKFILGEDTVFCSKLWISSNKVYLVDLPLYCYFINSDSITHILYSDKKWIDLIKTRFLAYENYLNYKNKKIAYFYLNRGISQINYYRFFSKGTDTEKFYKDETKIIYKKYVKKFLKCNIISFKSKVLFILFYYFPFAYKIYRKHFFGIEK